MGSFLSVLMSPDVVYPAATAAFGFLSYAATAVAGHFQQQAHASRVGMIADAAGRVAGQIADQLASTPAPAAGGVLATVKAAAIAQGVAYLQQTMPATIAKVGAPAETLAAMIAGELGKLGPVAAAAAPVMAAVAPAVTAAAPAAAAVVQDIAAAVAAH